MTSRVLSIIVLCLMFFCASSEAVQGVITSAVNFRSSPNGSKIGSLAAGTRIEILGKQGSWLKIRYQGRDGFVFSRYASYQNATEASACSNCSTAANNNNVNNLRAVTESSNLGRSLSYANNIMQFLGKGRAAGTNKCWRAVHNMLKAAGLVTHSLTQNSAKNAYSDLAKDGFYHDRNACNRPGVVRVYSPGPTPAQLKAQGIRSTAGDTHGHIEILGTDGNYHHFTSSSRPLSEIMPGRRILTHCLIKRT